MMWTPTDNLIILGSYLFHVGLFYIGFRYLHSSLWRKMGAKILENKERQLSKNLILRFFVWNVDSGRTVVAISIIAALIFIKCLGMMVGGLVFIGLVLVPVQGALMAVISKAMKEKGIDPKALKRTQEIQLTAMLTLNALGNLIGYHSNVTELSNLEVFQNYRYAVLIVIAIGLVISVIAARSEVKFFKAHRTLIG